ncbi:TPA: hypothetical protein ACX6RS_003047 [Photobacterium damselae]
MNKLSYFSVILLATLSIDVNALAIDRMVYIVDANGNDQIKLINNSKNKSFIRTKMSKIEVNNNELINIPLTNKNIGTWNLTLSPAKMIMEPNQRKSIGVHYVCSDCRIEKDQIYKLSIAPIPYGKNGKINATKIAFGFAPYVIVPATKQKPSYKLYMKKSRDEIVFSNTGNTLLTAVTDVCKKERNKQCNVSYQMLPGRTRSFKLTEPMMKEEKFNFNVLNHDETYDDKVIIKR